MPPASRPLHGQWSHCAVPSLEIGFVSLNEKVPAVDEVTPRCQLHRDPGNRLLLHPGGPIRSGIR